MVTPNQFGVTAYLWSYPLGVTTTGAKTPPAGNSLEMWDALTGNYILSIVGVPSMTLTEDQSGNLIGYFVNSSKANI
jgi:hypothetical protein